MVVKGVDMEALSPRDANAQRMPRVNELKTKAAAQLKTARDKEHPPPPPNNVIEPSSSDRKEGAVYQVGKLLGKGGFAICYDGKLAGTNKRFALKIVKCQMPTKMEQKVCFLLLTRAKTFPLTGFSSKPNCKFTRRCASRTLYSFTALLLLRIALTWSSNCVRMALLWIWSSGARG